MEAAVEVPECPKGHGPMVPRKAETPEQQFCGTWFDCAPGEPGMSCMSAVLVPSPELLAHLEGQRREAKPLADLGEVATSDGLRWTVQGPRGRVWAISWEPKRFPDGNVRAWTLRDGHTGFLGHATTAVEARAEALRIAEDIKAGKTRTEG